MDFLTLAKNRYSVRKLSSRTVAREMIDKIVEAGIVAPTAANRQPFKIWVMESQEAIEKVSQTNSFPFVKNAPVVFVIGGNIENAWRRRFDGHSFVDVDAAIVATHMMLEVHDLGLGTTWLGSFDPAKMKELFPEMERYELICVFAVGYPTEDAIPTDSHTSFKERDALVTML